MRLEYQCTRPAAQQQTDAVAHHARGGARLRPSGIQQQDTLSRLSGRGRGVEGPRDGRDARSGRSRSADDGRCYDRDDAELARCRTGAPPPAAGADPAEPLAAAGVFALTSDRLLNSLYQPIAMLARLSESSLI